MTPSDPTPDATPDRAPDATEELLTLSKRLLEAMALGDWATYESLCDPSLTCFEPEAGGHLVEGMDFHHFYFTPDRPAGKQQTTLSAPRVRMIGTDAAVVTYVRLIQSRNPAGEARTDRFEETRVWQRREGRWLLVHLHRSSADHGVTGA